MASDLSYPPTLDEAERQRLVDVVKDWSIAHGLAVRPPPASMVALAAGGAETGQLASTLAMPVPVTLFPSPFPRAAFQEAQAVQPAYNELYARISQDEAFLREIIDEVASGDEFTTSLWNVHLRVKQEGYTHKHALGIFRSDYLLHQDEKSHLPQIKQVEFNTIAASFGGLSAQAAQLHKFLAQTEYPLLRAERAAAPSPRYDLPPSTSSQDIATGLRAAFDVYVSSSESTLGLDRCVLFLVQDGERNVFDQRHIEYYVSTGGTGPSVPVFRVPFGAVLQHTRLADTPQRQLLYPLPTDPTRVFEVAVVYLRAGYGPSDYPDAAAWEGRYHIERSAAIKCPTVLTQVAGTKKVQQVLATPDGSASASAASSVLKRFVAAGRDGDSQADRIQRTFTNIYPLDATSAAGQQARAWAQDAQACRRFVLKPQREGGGNNYYKDKIPAQLRRVPEEHWASYILMELITPPPVANVILRNGQTEQGGVICELGIYGTCIWATSNAKAGNADASAIVRNETAGYLLRTKGDQSEEGGVAAGFGCMDSATLV